VAAARPHRLRAARRLSGGLSTSDLDAIFENALNKSLQASFAAAPQTWRAWCHVRAVNDLRQNPISRRSRLGAV
jgi:hypothetical protein